MGRFVGLDAQQVGEHLALVWREGGTVASGVEHGFALLGGHAAQVVEGGAHGGLAIGRQGGHAARGLVDLHALGGREAFDSLGAGQAAFALRLGKLIHIVQLLDETLLVAGIEAIEARLLAQEALLLGERQILMLGHPLGQMAGSLGVRAQAGVAGAVGGTAGRIAVGRNRLNRTRTQPSKSMPIRRWSLRRVLPFRPFERWRSSRYFPSVSLNKARISAQLLSSASLLYRSPSRLNFFAVASASERPRDIA